jgi:hypothetical protein
MEIDFRAEATAEEGLSGGETGLDVALDAGADQDIRHDATGGRPEIVGDTGEEDGVVVPLAVEELVFGLEAEAFGEVGAQRGCEEQMLVAAVVEKGVSVRFSTSGQAER